MRSLLVVAVIGCGHRSISEYKPKFDALSRDDFNRFAVRTNQPVFWIADVNHDRRIDPDEIASLLLYPTDGAWVTNHAFTPAFETAYNKIIAAWRETARGAELVPDPANDPDGRARRKLVASELDLGRTALVQSDLHGEAFVPHILAAARLVDQLYDIQAGAAALAPDLPADLESRSLFRRDHGAPCASSTYRMNALCSAIPGSPPQPIDVYPAVLQRSEAFCDAFKGRTVDRDSIERGATDVPYARAYPSEMHAISTELNAAADALHGSPESTLEDYLRAAAESFESNDWAAADAAFARVTPSSSKWYVRVGPDALAWDPCKQKAAFHLTFARHDPTVYPWPAFDSGPDVYDLIVAAGDGRQPFGARSVERAGGRTVVFANLLAHPDAVPVERIPVEDVLDPTAAAAYRDLRDVDVFVAMLREDAARARPATTEQLAPFLGELAVEVGVFERIEQLRGNHAITEELANQASLAFTVATLARMDELFDRVGARLADPHAAGILVGMLVEQGVLVWTATPSASGAPGSFSYHADRLPAAVAAIASSMTDRAAATALATRYADEKIVPYGVIAYRFRIAAVPTFVYSVIN